MITAVHTIVYTSDPDATRAFFRDVLEWPFVDAHGGWLIFGTGPSELGVHPTRTEHEGQVYESPLHHEITLLCDDIEGTVAALGAKGAEFTGPISDQGFGRTVTLKVPGAGDLMLYEPRHALAYNL